MAGDSIVIEGLSKNTKILHVKSHLRDKTNNDIEKISLMIPPNIILSDTRTIASYFSNLESPDVCMKMFIHSELELIETRVVENNLNTCSHTTFIWFKYCMFFVTKYFSSNFIEFIGSFR